MEDSNSKNLRNSVYGQILQSGNQSSGEASTIGDGLKGLSKDELELAFTVVLVDIASSDEHFDPAEYEVISSGLRRLFGTTKEQVKILVNQSRQILDSLRGTARYTDQLRENLSEADRWAVFSIIEELVEADSKEDPFEVFMRSRIARALDLKIEE